MYTYIFIQFPPPVRRSPFRLAACRRLDSFLRGEKLAVGNDVDFVKFNDVPVGFVRASPPGKRDREIIIIKKKKNRGSRFGGGWDGGLVV